MTAYVQSISVALTPVVPVLSVIVTFLVHISLGYELSPAEVRKLIMQYETVQMIELITLPFSSQGIRRCGRDDCPSSPFFERSS